MFASSIWPCIPYLVGSHQLGTAYGLMTVALNISLTLLPLAVANIRGSTETEGFIGVETFFVCLSLGGVLLGIVLNVLDARNGSLLQKSAFRRPQSAGGYSQLSAEEDYSWSPGSQDSAATTATAAEANLEGERDGGLSDADQEQEDMERDDANITTRVVAEGVVAMVRHYPRRHYRTRSVEDDYYAGGRAGGFRRPKFARQFRYLQDTRAASTLTGRKRSSSHPPRFRVQAPDAGEPAGAAAAPPTPATASAAVSENLEPAAPGIPVAAVSAPPGVDGGGQSDSELLFTLAAPAPDAGDV
ncbi:MAG: hypothetical protein BJ554DRAFT_2705 [Olpidium bornovanus]|uniref:Uncharacterized protein n=1 Tax=Olpidium bornovanus TaxID=278681 RepID=A0A8H7ZQ19_9FUNG|nr:MAG: hypothetical protein BJ554DRAFT_2705 [Olpidium bornovanus]